MKKMTMRTAAILLSAITLAGAGQALAAAIGDVNNDGSQNVADAVMLTKHLTEGAALTSAEAADLNGDGAVNAADLTLLKRGVLTESAEPVVPDEPAEPAETDDNYVTQITFASGSVTLKNAADQVVAADKASNLKVENGTYVTITAQTTDGTVDYGDINIDGECAEGQVKVDVDETAYPNAQVTLNLRGLTLSNSSDSPIYVSQIADECVIAVKKDTVNTISDGADYTNADQSAGAVYSLDDLKIKGKGTLIVNGNCGDGIVCKDDLKIWNGDIQVNSADDGIRGKDSIRIGDPDDTDYSALKVTVVSKGGDALKSTNDTADSGKGYIRINGGTVDLKAENGDGIQAEQEVIINGGDINIYTYQGSGYSASGSSSSGSTNPWQGGGFGGGMQDGNSNKTDISAKGIKAVGLYDEAGTTWQSMGNITVTGGSLTVTAADDGLHADGVLTVSGGAVQVVKSHEGLEGNVIRISGGSVTVYADDDGLNACAGAQTPLIDLAGGTLDVTTPSGDTDAVDSNGNFTMSGGFALIKGGAATGNMAGSVDVDGTVTVTGGTVVALGGICETPSNGSVNTYISSGTSFSAGAYTLAASDGTVLCSFTLAGSYSSCWIASDALALNGTYTLSKDGSSLLTWTQTSSTVGSAGNQGGFGGFGGGPGGMGGGGGRPGRP